MKKIPSLPFLFVLLMAVLASSCDEKKGPRMETITGRAGEVFVVLGKDPWKGKTGELIRDILAQPQSSLPQAEPMFDLTNVPPEAFVNVFKNGRNILNVKLSSTFSGSKVEFANDTWAYPQSVVNIEATSSEEFERIFKENSGKIISFFLKAEKDRLKSTYKTAQEKAIFNNLLKKFNLLLYAPKGFREAVSDSNFYWLRYDTPKITQNIFVYTYPYESDSTFTEAFLLEKRNQITKKYVEGPLKNTYMTTEMDLPRDFHVFKYDGNYACEIRGLWYVENDFMGGPFVSISVLDAANRRVVTVEGNVYAPKDDKRNYLRQVEAIVYSLEFPQQKVNDKINKKLEENR